MSNANQLIAQIRSDLKPIEHAIANHPYRSAIESRLVTRDLLKVFACQQYHIIRSDLRSIALLVSRHGALPSRDFLLGLLQGEAAALKALHPFAVSLGLNVSELEAFEPIPAAHAYCTFVAWLALYGSDAELAGAFLVNFAAWGANCGRMRKALHEEYDFPDSALAFFELFANMPASVFESEAISVVQSGLDRGVSAGLIHRAARMLQGYELMFWNAMADAACVRRDTGA
jgi:thiaminase